MLFPKYYRKFFQRIKMWAKKTFLIPKIKLVPKNFWSQNKVGPDKIFVPQKNVGLQNIFGVNKKFWSQFFFCVNKKNLLKFFFWSPRKFWSQIIFDPYENVSPRTILVPKNNFGPKKIWSQIFFSFSKKSWS